MRAKWNVKDMRFKCEPNLSDLIYLFSDFYFVKHDHQEQMTTNQLKQVKWQLFDRILIYLIIIDLILSHSI